MSKPIELFTDEDFRDMVKKIHREGYKSKGAGDMWEPDYTVSDVTKIANEKLAREGKVFYVDRGMTELSRTIKDEKMHLVIDSNFKNSFYKVTIINIQEIEKPCEHPPGKIALMYPVSPHGFPFYQCECGQNMKIKYEPVSEGK